VNAVLGLLGSTSGTRRVDLPAGVVAVREYGRLWVCAREAVADPGELEIAVVGPGLYREIGVGWVVEAWDPGAAAPVGDDGMGRGASAGERAECEAKEMSGESGMGDGVGKGGGEGEGNGEGLNELSRWIWLDVPVGPGQGPVDSGQGAAEAGQGAAEAGQGAVEAGQWPIRVRNLRAGDRIWIRVGRGQGYGVGHGRGEGLGHKKVSALLKDRKVPRYQRRRWPLVLHGDEIVWIPGLWSRAEPEGVEGDGVGEARSGAGVWLRIRAPVLGGRGRWVGDETPEDARRAHGAG